MPLSRRACSSARSRSASCEAGETSLSSKRGPTSSAPEPLGSKNRHRARNRARWLRHRFVVTVFSQPPAEGLSFRTSNRSYALRNAVCDMSSASLASPSSRTAVPNTMSWYLRTNASNSLASIMPPGRMRAHGKENPELGKKLQTPQQRRVVRSGSLLPASGLAVPESPLALRARLRPHGPRLSASRDRTQGYNRAEAPCPCRFDSAVLSAFSR